jgi:DinB superfamily
MRYSVVLLVALSAVARCQTPTIASAIDQEVTIVETLIVGAAEAMPEDRFSFSPEVLHIAGSEYKGVRTFAEEVKHIAASNYALWSGISGDTFPKDYLGGNGPQSVKTKAAIVEFLRNSFALGHKVASMLTTENLLLAPGQSKSTRLRLALFGVEHAYDHYGQMAEYLRMNGIVPPASR